MVQRSRSCLYGLRYAFHYHVDGPGTNQKAAGVFLYSEPAFCFIDVRSRLGQTIVSNTPVISGLHQHSIKHIRQRRNRKKSYTADLSHAERQNVPGEVDSEEREGRARRTVCDILDLTRSHPVALHPLKKLG
jgi:hypothetical protein